MLTAFLIAYPLVGLLVATHLVVQQIRHDRRFFGTLQFLGPRRSSYVVMGLVWWLFWPVALIYRRRSH